MISKTFNLLCLSIFTLILFVGLGSATITISQLTPSTLPQTSGFFSITITTNQNETITFFGFNDIVEGSDKITFTPLSQITLNNNSQIINVTYTVPSGFDFKLGKLYSTTLIASGVSTVNATQTLSFEINNQVCEYNNPGNLDIRIRDISVEEGFGDDDDYWYPLDEIEVEVEVENNGNEDIDDIEVAWGLYNLETQEWVIDDEENDFNLKYGDDKTVIINFKLDDVDEFEDDGDYRFYVWATGEVDGGTYDGEQTCDSNSKSIEVIIEDDFVVLDNIEFSEIVSCGTEVQITADVWNIGEDDQDDVSVRIYNKALGIDEVVELGDIDAFEDERLSVIVEIPEDAEEKFYPLRFWVYDEDSDVYENNEDDESEVVLPLKVEGNCAVEQEVVVSAGLESGGKAGEELVIKAIITNTGSKLATYTLEVEGYTEWASLFNIEPSTVILGEGESKEVLITFNVNKDTLGDELFNIEVFSDKDLITKQPVSITIDKSGYQFPGITGSVIGGDNKYLWGIGLLNIILVIIIIIVAIRVARK